MNHHALPEGGPEQPPIPLTTAPSAVPGANPLPHGVHHTSGVAAPAPSHSSTEESDPFDLERYRQVDEREVSQALINMAGPSSAVLGPSGVVAPDGTPVGGPPPSRTSDMSVLLGHVNRALESHRNASGGEVGDGFSPNNTIGANDVGVGGFEPHVAGRGSEEVEGEGETMEWETFRYSAGSVEGAPIGGNAEYLGLGNVTEDGIADMSDSEFFHQGTSSSLEVQVGSSRTLQQHMPQGGTRNTLLDGENRPVFLPQQREHRVNGYRPNEAARGFTPTTAAATTTTTVATTTTTGATYGAGSSMASSSVRPPQRTYQRFSGTLADITNRVRPGRSTLGMTRLPSEDQFLWPPPSDDSIERIRSRAALRRHRTTLPPGILLGDAANANNAAFVA